MGKFDFDPNEELTAMQIATYGRFRARMMKVDFAFSDLQSECASFRKENLMEEDLRSAIEDDLRLLCDEVEEFRGQFWAEEPAESREWDEPKVADVVRTDGPAAVTAGAATPVQPRASNSVAERLRRMREQMSPRTGGGGPAAGSG